MFPQKTAAECLIALLFAASLSAQEDFEIPSWSAPLFFSFPKPDKGEADSPPAERPYSTQGAEPELLPLVTIPPCRIADTRGLGFSGQAGPPALNTGPRVFQITGTVPGIPLQCGVPTTARAVSFQFTIVTPNSAGNLIAWPGGPPPTISVLNWSAGETALGNGTVVPISVTGSLSVQINAAIGGATGHLVLDVNGYYGPSLDTVYVNEGQASSVNSSMIADGAIVNADVNASAAIADTKLATIATAGKVADTALSANVTRLGQTIESAEITDETIDHPDIANFAQIVSIPLTSFVDCQTGNGALLDFSSAADTIADFSTSSNDGHLFSILFDATGGSEDQLSEICSQIFIPGNWASGGEFLVRGRTSVPASLASPSETVNCSVYANGGSVSAPASVTISSVSPDGSYSVSCIPALPVVTQGDVLGFSMWISTTGGTMNNPVAFDGVAFVYQARQ